LHRILVNELVLLFVGCGFDEMYEYEVEGAKPRGRPKKIWTVIVEKDARHVN